MTRHFPALEPGANLQERYIIQGVIGGGGLTRVYQAQDLFQHDITQPVAIKEFRFNPAMVKPYYANVLETFRQAAGFLMGLKHPALPRIGDFFESGERAYLVMQYVEGIDLQTWLDQNGPVSAAQAIRWGIALCDVLNYLHQLEPDPFIFCNTTPSNIMVDRHDQIWLVDYGLSNIFLHRILNANIGPAGYSPPELYMGVINQGTDVYGLGTTLHHLLSGQDPRLAPPFSFDQRPIGAVGSTVPQALEAVVMKALEPVPSDRFQNCSEMKTALERLAT